MANDSPQSRVRVSRMTLGSMGGGMLLATVANVEAVAQGKSNKGTPSAPLARRGCSVTTYHSGLIMVAGGIGSNPTSAVQFFDPRNNTWTDGPPMNTPRAHHAAVLLPGGRVLVTGGRFLDVLGTAEIYDPRTNEWTFAAPMNGPRAEHGAVEINGGTILVTGGVYLTPLSSVELYDVGADAWRRL